MKNSRWWRRLLVASTLLGTVGGCAEFQDCRYESAQRLRACAELRDCGVPQCENFPADYKKGFKDGFYTVSTGGPCCPPAVAPHRYWNVRTQLADCDNRRHSYYNGWQDGAARAVQYPDTHHLRLFETCECKVPRCGGGACGCAVDGVGYGFGPGMSTGLINDDLRLGGPVVVGDDPLFGGGPMAGTDGDESTGDDAAGDESSDDSADRPAMIDAADDDGNDGDDDTSAKDSGDDVAGAGSNKSSDASSEKMDAELIPSPSDTKSAPVRDSQLGRDPAGAIPPLPRTPGVDGVPAKDDSGVIDDIEAAAGKELSSTVVPAREFSFDDWGGDETVIDPRAIAQELIAEVMGEKERNVRSAASAEPLDRTTIQMLFGLNDDFDADDSGVISALEFDPMFVDVDGAAADDKAGSTDQANVTNEFIGPPRGFAPILENSHREPTVRSARPLDLNDNTQSR